jgi:hypothetical protein
MWCVSVFRKEEFTALMRSLLYAALSLAALIPVSAAEARDTGFDPRIVTFGETREQIKSTPINQRPNRPLHVYGNTVRRRTSRGGSGGR